MALGSTKTIVICIPASSANATQQTICPRKGGQYNAPSTAQAYLIASDQQSNFEAAFGNFDYGYAAGAWSIAFSTVVGLYFMSHGIGLVLGMIRRR